MILYHGTNITFETIDLLKSKPNKDFGQGFYLTTDKNQAIEMAKAKIDQQGQGKVIVYTYEFDDNLLNGSSLKIKTFDNYTEEWALFILANRNNFSSTPVHDYDIVIGPIADDRVGLQLRRYMDDIIDMETLIKKLTYMKGMTIQYFFGSISSISKLIKT